ncbi:MAG: aminotransferase class III-fold pyridoxal phosphate-dependent enzyme [Rhodospirillales bacterium]|nr:aminotransferase class III-fold pyridoxal phosphate-dependent enzyme [Rhodospirillales bacterium]
MKLDKSQALLERARAVIPSATQTFSKGPNQWVRGVSPAYLERGEGAWVWDADGNKYLDYLMALGPVILGYGDKVVNGAIQDQLERGQVFSQMHPLEVEVAEKLVQLIPCAEMVRFAKNGSDATTGAIRAARAYTKRDHIVYCGYHGWHDWYIGTTTRNAGVPKAVQELSHSFTYNDVASLKAVFDAHPKDIAAVIMEPVGVEMPDEGFLETVRDLAHENGSLLIFDEIINGFRLAFGGSQEMLGVTPDLATFGKAMANGMPLSAVVGRREVMEIFDEIFFSGTFGGDAVALAACKATIDEMEKRDVIAHIREYGKKLNDGIRTMIEQYALKDAIGLVGFEARSILSFPNDDEALSRLRRSYFMQECHKRGLLFFGAHLPTDAHGEEELAFTLKVYSEVFPLFAAAYQGNDFADRMEGEVVEPIFRKP